MARIENKWTHLIEALTQELNGAKTRITQLERVVRLIPLPSDAHNKPNYSISFPITREQAYEIGEILASLDTVKR